MAGKFNLDDYETVETRLAKFWSEHPDGRVLTDELLHPYIGAAGMAQYVVKASVFFDRADDRPVATGIAEEVLTSKGVNMTSALENCETSAIGRALANCGYAAKGQRPSREEMAKVQRAQVRPLDAEELTRLAGVIAACDAMGLDQLRDVWKAHTDYLDVLPEGATTTLRDAIVTRKAAVEAGAA